MSLLEDVARHTIRKLVRIAGVVMEIVFQDQGFNLGLNYRHHKESFKKGEHCELKLRCKSAQPCFNPRVLPFQASNTVQSKFLLRKASCLFMRKDEVLIARSNFSNCCFWSASRDYLTASKPFLGDCGWPLLALWGFLSIRGAGLLLHGSLLKIDNRHILLLGGSGVGKSTLSRLAVMEGATCLTDENPFLRCHNGLPLVYGTPWYSDSELIPNTALLSPEVSRELDAVFLIHHAPHNQIHQMSKTQAGFALLKNTRTFNWLPDTIPAAVGLLDNVARKIPVYSYGFMPNKSAVTFLRKAIQQHNER